MSLEGRDKEVSGDSVIIKIPVTSTGPISCGTTM
jgi:hypothetical protein